MTIVVANQKVKRGAIYATVNRANGDVEYLGMVSYAHENWIINAIGQIYVKCSRAYYNSKYAIRRWWRARNQEQPK